MTIHSNLTEYHKSIGEHLTVLQNQVRNLIGDAHWLSDGAHKEAILRQALKEHICSDFHVGTGFAIADTNMRTTQIDILISQKAFPCLFQEGDFRIISMDAVSSLIEVKTKQNKGALVKTLTKLSENIFKVRKCYGAVCDQLLPTAGLFVYEEPEFTVEENLQEIIQPLWANRKFINWICLGQNYFIRYWHEGDYIHLEDATKEIKVPQYRLYRLNGLAMAYFISNVVCDIPEIQQPQRQSWCRNMDGLWFPIEGGKETQFIGGLSKNGKQVKQDGTEI